MKKDLYLVLLVTAILLTGFLVLSLIPDAAAETVYVSISKGSYLNGRAEPRKSAQVTMKLYDGDELEVIAMHGEWAEVVGGETGTSFCKAQYLSTIKDPVVYTNTSGGRVRVRKTPIDGKSTGWIAAGDTVKVTKVVMGWGYIKDGWVDLRYFE